MTNEPAIRQGYVYTRLAHRERMILLAAMGRPLLTRTWLVDFLWPNAETMPETAFKMIDAVIFQLRKKIEPFGWTFINVWGRGFYLAKTAGDEPGDHCAAYHMRREATGYPGSSPGN